MAYTKQNFVDQQVLTAGHLNHIESGIAALDSGIAELESGIAELSNGTDSSIAALDSEITELNNAKIEMKLLWTNASPSSSFSAQDVALDLSSYAGVIIEYCHHTSRPNDLRSAFCEVGKTLVLQSIYSDFYNGSDANGNPQYAYRRASISESKVGFATGFYATGTGKVAEDKKIDVPYKIYGIKGVT